MKAKLMLLAVILVGLALRSWGAAGKTTISHDEAISYLGATGNLGRYQTIQDGGNLAGEWTTTAEWQTYLAVHDPIFASLQTIAADQAAFDIHPPLYFWLLYRWALIWGITPWVGSALNIMFFLLAAPALYGLARYLLKDEQEAVFVTLVWTVSPAVLQTAVEARQYDLLGLLTILFAWLLAVCLDTNRTTAVWQWLLLGLLAAAGNLTHYHFILVVVGGFLVFGWRQLRQDGRIRPSRRLLTAVGVVAAGYALSFLLHPTFLSSFTALANRQVEEATFFLTPLDVMRRIFAAVVTFTGFWVYARPLQLILFVVFMSSLVFAGLTLARNRRRLIAGLQQVDWTGSQALLLALWLGGISIVMYLTFISPIHAMTARHMSAVWPFYAFLAVFLMRAARAKWQEHQFVPFLGPVLAILMVVFGGLSVWQANKAAQSRLEGLDILEATPALLVDTVHRGVLPQLLIHVAPDKQIFAAWQDALLERPEAWLTELPNGSLYLSEGAYGNSAEEREAILALLDQRFEIRPIDEPIPGMERAYLLIQK